MTKIAHVSPKDQPTMTVYYEERLRGYYDEEEGEIY